MSEDGLRRAQRDIQALREQVVAVRLTVLRILTALTLVLVVIGVFLPFLSATVGGEDRTYRLATIGFQMLADLDLAEGKAGPITIAIGFLGLLLCLALYVAIVGEAILDHDQFVAPDWVRNLTSVLTIIGTVVATLFSAFGAMTSSEGSRGGWGALVTLVGLGLTVAIMRNPQWHDLWLYPPDQAAPRRRTTY